MSESSGSEPGSRRQSTSPAPGESPKADSPKSPAAPMELDVPASSEFSRKLANSNATNDRRPARGPETLPSEELLDPLRDIAKHPDALRRNFEHHFGAVRKAKGPDAKFLLEYDRYVIGCGVVRFVGRGSVKSVVRISEDPNDRGNPRMLVQGHMDRLRQSIEQRGKHDWEKPLVVQVPRRLLDPEMQAALKAVPAFQRAPEAHYLTLNNVTEEERRLSEDIHWRRAADAPPDVFLTEEELAQRKARHDELVSARELAMLLNGNHRIHVGIERAEELYLPVLDEVVELQKRFFRDHEEGVKEEMAEKARILTLMQEEHTWQVLVISDDAPDEFRQALMVNYDHDPQMGENAGEAVWMLASGIVTSMKRWQLQFPNESHSDIMDRVHNEIEDEHKRRELTQRGGVAKPLRTEVNVPIGSSAKRVKKNKAERAKERREEKLQEKNGTKRTGLIGGAHGKDMWSRIIIEPVMLEMLLSTKACLIAYTEIMGTTYVNTLLQPGSGVLAGLFWLSIETLLKITNGSNDEHLDAAIAWLEEHEEIKSQGYSSAVAQWNEMLSVHHEIPLGLKAITSQATAQFGTIWSAKRFPTGAKYDEDWLDRDWDSPPVLLKSRESFDLWGLWVMKQDPKSLAHQRTGVMARLKARLPTWNPMSLPGSSQAMSSSAARFHPRATLPSKELVSQWVRIANTLGDKTGGAWDAVEYLVDRNHLMWSMASGDPATKPRHNWYGSSRGTFYILMSYFQATGYGPIESRLSAFLDCMGRGSVHRALIYANKAIDPTHTLNGRSLPKQEKIPGLKNQLGAWKSEGFTPDPETLEQLYIDLKSLGVSSCSALIREMKRSIPPLRDYIATGNPGDGQFERILQGNRTLQAISNDYWTIAPVILWGSGWQNASTQRQGHTAGVIIGWGLIHDHYSSLVLDSLLLHRRAWPLVDVAQGACDALGLRPWWTGQYDTGSLALDRRQVISKLMAGVEWEDNEESPHESDDEPEAQYITRVPTPDHMDYPPTAPASTPPSTPPPTSSKGKGNAISSARGRAGAAKSSGATRRSIRETKPVELGVVPLTGPAPTARKPSAPARRSGKRDTRDTANILVGEMDEQAMSKEFDYDDPSSFRDETYDIDWDDAAKAYMRDYPNAIADVEYAMDKMLEDGEVVCLEPLADEDQDDVQNLVDPKRFDLSDLRHPSLELEWLEASRLQMDIIREFPPHPFVLSGWFSARLTAGYVGQVVAARRSYEDVDDSLLTKGLLTAHEDTLQLLPHIFEARRGLRHDICIAIGSVLDSYAGFEALMDRLAPTLYILKTSYVKQVATLICNHTGTMFVNALVEAVWMASTDGLFENELFSVDGETGDVRAQLKSCFPLSMHRVLPKDGAILIGKMKNFAKRRDQWEKISHVAQLAVAPGPTQSQALHRAFLAVPTLAYRDRVERDDPSAAIALHDDQNVLPSPQLPIDQAALFRSYGAGNSVSGEAMYQGFRGHFRTERRTLQSSRSSLSTGQVIPQNFTIRVNKSDGGARPAIFADLIQVRTEARTYWNKACERELEEHERMRTYFQHSFPSYVVEPPVLGSARWPNAPEPGSTSFSRVLSAHSVVELEPRSAEAGKGTRKDPSESHSNRKRAKRSPLVQPGSVASSLAVRHSLRFRQEHMEESHTQPSTSNPVGPAVDSKKRRRVSAHTSSSKASDESPRRSTQRRRQDEESNSSQAE